MKKLTFAAALAAAWMATSAIAQTAPDANEGDRAGGFDGVKAGASIDNRRHEVKRDAPPLTGRIDERSGGVGYRVFAGYDRTIGGIGLVGVETGIGNGGKDVQEAVAGGRYRMDPGWAWDASVRFGVLPTPNLLLYGRAGYGWTRARETITPAAIGQSTVVRKGTDGGFMYGLGAEFQVARGFAIRTEFDQTDFGKGFKAARLQLGGVIRF